MKTLHTASLFSLFMVALVLGVLLSFAVPIAAQVGGAVAQLYADDLFITDDADIDGDLDVEGNTIIDPVSYTDDTEACAAGLVVGEMYHDDSAATVVVVAACS